MTPDLPAIYTLLDGLIASQQRDMLVQFALAHPEAFEAALKEAELLRQAVESADPYAPYVSPYTAQSAAEVAADVPGPHLEEHKGASSDCIVCHGPHQVARTAPCTVPAAHGAYPKGSADCNVPGHHAEVFDAR